MGAQRGDPARRLPHGSELIHLLFRVVALLNHRRRRVPRRLTDATHHAHFLFAAVVAGSLVHRLTQSGVSAISEVSQ